MTNYWREVGLNYIQYSNICAKVVRQALRADLRADAVKRDVSHVKFTQWKDGKPVAKQEAESGVKK
ncbi:protein stunted-like [Lucilia sericata]|uniref:protein stunted-like n=1 Tax=Lucilia sericata TaxID=13632 RepID=UPI0018A81120|nr:protein stunted-like [Lucilia sericata]